MSNVECRVSIELHGVLTRLAGGFTLTLELASGSTVGAALAALATRRPELAGMLPNCACAIDDAIVPRSRALTPGARLALLPPVSGG
jgi:sulfur-carrier protein